MSEGIINGTYHRVRYYYRYFCIKGGEIDSKKTVCKVKQHYDMKY